MENEPIQFQPLTAIDLHRESTSVMLAYANFPLTLVNDHVVRLSIMTEAYFWHLHPNSDESFLVVEGSLLIDLEDRTVELLPNQLLTIPKNTSHRTRPGGSRSVNLTFESRDMETLRVDRDSSFINL